MAAHFNFNCIFLLILSSLTLVARTTTSSPTRSSYFKPDFDPEIDLLGDTQRIDGGSYVKLTSPPHSGYGLLLQRNPVRFGNPLTSFSTVLSFSISPGDGDGMVLVWFPGDVAPKFTGKGAFGISLKDNFLCVEFDTSVDGNVGDLNANHVGIDVGSLLSVAVGNVSDLNLVLNSGEKLKTWIDYDANSKRLEVRLSRFDKPRPFSPIVAYGIDLFKMWGDQDVFVGIGSLNGSSKQAINVYSWRLSPRKVPNWMHSLPVDPRGSSDEHLKHAEKLKLQKTQGNYYLFTLLAWLIFVSVCVALMAYVVLFMWAVFANGRVGEEPEKILARPMDFRYERIDVAVEKITEDDKD